MPHQTAPSIIDGALNAPGLAVVHSTSHKPALNDDGSVDLPSTYIATGGREARSTIHFTLNHKVSSHLYGSWDEADFAIIAPFNDVVERNGAPAMIVPSDTFWTTNACDPMHMPDASVVMPAENPIDRLVAFDGRRTFYKTSGFTAEDEAVLTASSGIMQEKVRAAAGTPEREVLLRHLSMENAVHETLTHRGYEVEPGNQWAWVRPDYHYSMANGLAESLGTKGSIPHMNTPYYAVSEHMNSLLTLADYFEARAGNGNTLKTEGNQIVVCGRDGEPIGALNRLVVSIYEKEDPLPENLQRLQKSASSLDDKTQDVIRDFSSKISDRITTARAKISADGGTLKNTFAGADLPEAQYTAPESDPQEPRPASMTRTLDL